MTVPVHGLPLVVREGLTVCVVPPRLKGPRERKVTSCADSETGQLVHLSGIDDLGAASELVGRTLLVSEADLPAGFALHDVPRLMGRPVRDARAGELGRIREVMRGPANDVWVVVGPLGEVLVPVVDAYVTHVSDHGDIEVNLPNGIVCGAGKERPSHDPASSGGGEGE